jgi:hypothetical protein
MKKVWLILLLLLGAPLIFFGTCFPIGLYSFDLHGGGGWGVLTAIIIGIAVTAWFVWYMLKEINESKFHNETEEEQRKRGIVYDPSRKSHKK